MKNVLLLILTCSLTHAFLHAQIGKVGINTTTPVAMLHVKDSSVLFAGINPLPGIPGNPPASDALPDGLVIASARVVSVGLVEVKFSNITAVNLNAASMDYYVTVIR